MIPVVILLHPHLGEHFIDALRVGLGVTLAVLRPSFFFLNIPHPVVSVQTTDKIVCQKSNGIDDFF